MRQDHPPPPRLLSSLPKKLYRACKWHYLKIVSRGWVDKNITINPAEIAFGQTPESQFPPKHFLGGYRDGDWDLQLRPVEEHPLYQSYGAHFLRGEPWEKTPFYQFALNTILQGKAFRGEYRDRKTLLRRFEKCDALYQSIQQHGYKSNHQLYREGLIDNELDLMDEVTVNIGRDGNLILNDGWHRFCTARMVGITSISARVCAIHTMYKDAKHHP
jgi:hypothetical protein